MKVKVMNLKTKVVKEIEESLLGTYLGIKDENGKPEWEKVEDKKTYSAPTSSEIKKTNE